MVPDSLHDSDSLSKELSVGDVCTLKVEHLGSRGEGIARANNTRVFLSKTAPGDVVRAQLKTKIRGQWVAEVLEVIEPSPHRIQPACQHFQDCGGCDFQHLTYEFQIEWKEKITGHWISRSPLQPFTQDIELEIYPAQQALHYRHRTRMQFENGQFNYHKPRSQELLPLQECPVLTPALWNKVLETAKDKNRQGELSLSATSHSELSYEVAGRKLAFDESCFTQGNEEQNQKLLGIVSEEISSLETKSAAWDLYAGIGNFTALMAQHFKKIAAVESHPKAVQFGRQNIPEAQWIKKDVYSAIVEDLKVEDPDLVILDPSREGALSVCRLLANREISKIVYVSCQLDSLIRDLTPLVKSKKYKIARWCLVDLFPQTRHLESVVVLTLN